MPTVPVETFRSAMGDVATPVTVVTAAAGGVPHGTTVSAFASLSMDPPMVLVALDLQSDLLGMLRRTRRYGVNVLAADSGPQALTFARKGGDKFLDVQWSWSAGLPRLDRAAVWLSCDVVDFIEGGDHLIAIGLVTAAQSHGHAPLVYHARRFGTHSAYVVPVS